MLFTGLLPCALSRAESLHVPFLWSVFMLAWSEQLLLKSQLQHFIKPCSYHHNPILGPEEPSSDSRVYFQFKACSQKITKSPSCEKIFPFQTQISEKTHRSLSFLLRMQSSNLFHIFRLVKLISLKPLNPPLWGFAYSSGTELKIHDLGILHTLGTL